MLSQTKTALPQVVEMLGELHPLMAQLGSADGLVTLSSVSTALRLPQVDSLPALNNFLEAYVAQILLPIELPGICRAFHHASRNEVRELVALDQHIARLPILQELASASERVGRCQLERLRPLRDERVVQRYLKAVHEHRAHGWHTLVYGLTLALYSLPVRQGLMTYARQTLHGFVQTAAHPLHLTKAQCRHLLEDLCRNLPRQLETIVAEEAISPGNKD